MLSIKSIHKPLRSLCGMWVHGWGGFTTHGAQSGPDSGTRFQICLYQKSEVQYFRYFDYACVTAPVRI
jgi:hypothetical protein